MARPGNRRRRGRAIIKYPQATLAEAAALAYLEREKRKLLVGFLAHLNRVPWDGKTDDQLVDEYLAVSADS